MVDEALIRSFLETGRDIFLAGLISSHGGNLSVRLGDRILITRRGSMLGRLSADELVETDIEPGPKDERCSRELVVHREVYRRTEARAVAHAHPVHAIARSFGADAIVPEDSEGRYVLGEVPVVTSAETIGSPEAARLVADALAKHPVVVLRTHGAFARGETLEEAFYHLSVLEASARILDLLGR
ncbi:class II aldolase/adducin family protein [Coriobacteriia bacterium Es71-Z0120]|uniref:class II aldolase/adducin family protein n=1 Tax=Parvivirga hydrogeniphila TaxID=2939460 RepID=UPI002260B5E5|nr:class II aldolase/adducin family protein [Parvivirga hydrogeniphila]MCL4078839.1 class II aldolase/adducin family protein [Parvivirga hydrogeniphila]